MDSATDLVVKLLPTAKGYWVFYNVNNYGPYKFWMRRPKREEEKKIQAIKTTDNKDIYVPVPER